MTNGFPSTIGKSLLQFLPNNWSDTQSSSGNTARHCRQAWIGRHVLDVRDDYCKRLRRNVDAQHQGLEIIPTSTEMQELCGWMELCLRQWWLWANEFVRSPAKGVFRWQVIERRYCKCTTGWISFGTHFIHHCMLGRLNHVRLSVRKLLPLQLWDQPICTMESPPQHGWVSNKGEESGRQTGCWGRQSMPN